MPYLNPTVRPMIDGQLAELITALKNAPGLNQPEAVNYCINRMLAEVLISPEPLLTYNDVNTAAGVLRLAAAEFEARVVRPMAEQRCAAYGDVYPASVVKPEPLSDPEPLT